MSYDFDFRMLDEWAEGHEPVFIVGPERSGTSMMFRTVVSHPSFCGFQDATVETFCFIRPYQLFDAATSANYEMRVYLGKQYEQFKQAIEPLHHLNIDCDGSGLPRSFFDEQRKLVWNRRNYRTLLRAFFYFSWLNLGQKRIAEKTPAHVRCMGEIMRCFPKAKILVCLRDPLEVIASHRKRLARELELGKSPDDPSLDWLSKSTNHYLEYFNHVSQLIGQAQRLFPSAIKLIPYNRVTTSGKFLASIFAFIREDAGKVRVEGEVTKGKSLDWDPLLASLPVENRIDWQAWMTEEEAQLVRDNCTRPPLKDWAIS